MKKVYLSGILAELELKDLVLEATAVAEAQVTTLNESSLMSNIGGSEGFEVVWTAHTLKVANVLKDASPSIVGQEITVRTLGGTYANISMNVEGEAEFEERENVVVFLSNTAMSEEPLPRLQFAIYGGFQGKYTIQTENDRRFVTRVDQQEGIDLTLFRRQISGYLEPPAAKVSAAGS